MRKLIASLVLALALAIGGLAPSVVFADTSDTVTVTAAPSYISISISPDTWTINGITGSGKIAIDTTYYANPNGDTTVPTATVVDGDCQFTVTNSSTVETDLTANLPNFTGGDAMTNIDTGYTTNGANAFGASTYVSGAAWPGGSVILKSTGSDAMKADLAATTNIKFGVALKTQSGAWSSGDSMSGTITVTATDST